MISYIFGIFRGAVAQDARIEPGDMLLEVNGNSFEKISNDEAVKLLREAVHNPGYFLNTFFIRIVYL